MSDKIIKKTEVSDEMKKTRFIAAALCAAVFSSMLPAAVFASDTETSAATGSLQATLRFDYPQRLEKVKEKDINVTLYKGNEQLGSVSLDGEATGILDVQAQVSVKNTDGVNLTTESEIGYFDVDVSGLEQGKYSFSFEGDGYVTYKTPEIEIKDYSRQVILGTGDKTFSIGDVNKDGKVNTTDRDLLTAALSKTDAASLSSYDLNGDGKINIIDLAYVNHQINPEGELQIFDTSLIAQNIVETTNLSNQVLSGSAADMFAENNDKPVTLGNLSNDETVVIPIEFTKSAEMEQIEIVSPEADGALTAGFAEVTYEENGRDVTETIQFDYSVPDVPGGIEMLNEREGTKSVVIALGKRVAVKKIIINVTKVEGQDGTPQYAVVQEVKFLKEIVPDNPAAQSLTVKNVKTHPLNESVSLTWNEFPNISGYKVYYGTKADKLEDELTVSVNSATVKGLDNLKTYYFTVTPISEGWEGGRSEIVSAIPMPDRPPLKPDMVTITPMDRALTVSWKATENAEYYKVFYKEKEADKYTQFGDIHTATRVSIGDLKNGQEYYIYIKAGNLIGEGPQSDLALGIPQKQDMDAPKIPILHKLDSSNIESIVMENKNNVLKSEYPNGFDVKNVADDDYSTHWTARVFWESNRFTFTFKKAKEMNYMVYVPRLDGNYRKSLERYTITVWDEYGNQSTTSKYITINSNSTGYMILPFEKTKVKKLAVSLAQWAGSPTGVSLAEAIFYESDNLESEVRGLFANETYTALKDAVIADKEGSKEKIESLRAQASDADGYYVDKDILLDELNLAEALLDGKTDALGYIKNGIQSRSKTPDGNKYGQSSSDLQPLGVVAYATEYAEKQKMQQTKVTVYAKIPEGEKVFIVPTQYYAEANAWQGSAKELQNGRNMIEIPKMGSQTSERGGALYLRYSGTKPEEISLQVRQGAQVIPVLELSDWYKIDETEKHSRISEYVKALEKHTAGINKNNISLRIINSTEISMPNTLLSVAAQPVMNAIKPTGATDEDAVNTLYNNVLAWEDLMHVCNTTQGIDNTLENSDMQSRQNIRYMRMFGKAFMYAAGNHIGIGYGSIGGVSCGKPVSSLADGAKSNKLFGWGIAHEIGHNMDKLGKAEITNNIYSLMAQTYDGKQNTLISRLESSNKYKSIYDKVAAGRPGMSNDVFTQLGMYWQLHLAYDDGDNPMGFYNALFKEWKKGGISGVSSDERFALIAAKTANRDLTEFFERWGMRLSENTKKTLASYQKETRKIQYLNDNSRRYRLSGGAAGEGVTTAHAAVDAENEKQINLTFKNTSDAGTVLGYEISRNGQVIAFVTAEHYEDVIGSANNKAFTYTVQAVDMLGNKIGDAANADQVRISYVKTVDKNKYTQTVNEDGSISVKMKEPTAVSGIKVTNAPQTGEFTVSIKCGDYEEPVTAKAGSFEKNETPGAAYYVAYFNKPKTSSDDTRIWTYDAEEITLTGIGEGASVEFISYPGDNIEFNEDATVGRLSADYKYGDGEDDVITAGTLIVTGTYRGDPVYNTVQICGRFVSVNPETAEQTTVERAIDGEALLFAEIPEDGEVSDISDGIFIFIPNVQKEAALQGEGSECAAESLLPAQLKAELYRTDTAESTESKRLTSDTIWIDSPLDDDMPEIILE